MTQYAWKYRYPADAQEPTGQEVDMALAVAREALAAIRALVTAETSGQ